ncbi:MAG: hypothetical protein ABIF17_02365 [Patescibacteria group bacterium]
MRNKTLKTITFLLVVGVFLTSSIYIVSAKGGYLKYRVIHKECQGNSCPSFASDYNDSAVCGGKDSCVYDGKCYNYDDVLKINGSYEFCNQYETYGLGKWYDPDTLRIGDLTYNDLTMCEYLGLNIAKAGEDRVGEYERGESAGQNMWPSYECCGDDKNEFYIIDKTDIYRRGYCCNNKNDVVVNGKCYTKSKIPAVR